MAKGFNKVILMGNLTRDVEVRTTASGQSVANFSLAVNRSWRGQDGQQQDQTSFINCVAWGKVGDIIAQYVRKGSPLLVSGRLDQRSYQDKDGNKRSALKLLSKISILSVAGVAMISRSAHQAAINQQIINHKMSCSRISTTSRLTSARSHSKKEF